MNRGCGRTDNAGEQGAQGELGVLENRGCGRTESAVEWKVNRECGKMDKRLRENRNSAGERTESAGS